MKNIIILTLLFGLSGVVNATDDNSANSYSIKVNQKLADNSSNLNASDKRCMMVCIEWEQKCVKDSKTGKENCRRVCKEFGEQCF